MKFPAFFGTVFPPLLIPLACWILGMLALRKMNRTSKNLFFLFSLLLTILLMIALLILRLVLRSIRPAWSMNVLCFSVTIVLLCGVGIFLRAWSLYGREILSAEEIAPYCAAGFWILFGAALSFHIVYLGAA